MFARGAAAGLGPAHARTASISAAADQFANKTKDTFAKVGNVLGSGFAKIGTALGNQNAEAERQQFAGHGLGGR